MYLIFFFGCRMAARLSLTQDKGTLPPACAAWHVPLTKYACWSGMSANLTLKKMYHFGSRPWPSETDCSKGLLDFFLVLRWRREMQHLRQCGYGADLHIPIDKVGCWHTWTASRISLWADPNFCGQIHLTAEWWCSLRKFNHDYGKKGLTIFENTVYSIWSNQQHGTLISC